MRYRIVGLVATVLAASTSGQDVDGRLKALAASKPSLVELSTLGTSRQGRPLHVAWLTDRGGGAGGGAGAETRPALVLIAGANGMHRVGVETALGVAEKLAADHAELLKTTSVYIIPMLNPDAFAVNAEAGKPRMEWSRTISPTDADRDGRTNEDPAEDLNGDGLITLMRVENPPPGSPLTATQASDPENPRLMKSPDAAKGEAAKYAVVVEGTDNDGDGKFNEDGLGGSAGGGVELDWNLPYRWKEWGDGVGPYTLSEPESLSLVQWMLKKDTIAAVVVFGPHDTLVKVPEAGKFDDSGQVPLGIENDDKPYYEEISKAFKDITKITATAASPDNAGSIAGWTYAHFGVWTFATPVWVRPDQIKTDEPKKDGADKDAKEGEAKPADPPAAPPPQRAGEWTEAAVDEHDDHDHSEAGFGQPAQPAGGQPGGGGGGGRRGARFPGGPPGGGGGGGGADQAPSANPEDSKWLKYSDEKRAGGGGAGFIEWKEFDHPQLGKVEIGGFVPGFRMNPPEEELARLADEQAKFVALVAGKLPRITLETPRVESVGPGGGGVWRITARVVNSGYFPSLSAIGVKARRQLSTVLTPDVPVARIISGPKNARFGAIPGSGGAQEQEWIIAGDAGSTITFKFNPTIGPEQSVQVTLQEAAR